MAPLNVMTPVALSTLPQLFLQTASSFRDEDAYVRCVLGRQQDLLRAVTDGLIIPVSKLLLSSLAERTIYVHFSPSAATTKDITERRSKVDRKIQIHLRQFDKSMVRASQDSTIPRVISVRAMVYTSGLRILQRHINFGPVKRHDPK